MCELDLFFRRGGKLYGMFGGAGCGWWRCMDQGKWYRLDIIQQLRCNTDTCELCKWQCKAHTVQYVCMGQHNIGKYAEIQCGVLCQHIRNIMYDLPSGFILCRKCNISDGMCNWLVYKCDWKKCMYGMYRG